MEDVKVLFIGTPAFACSVLQALVDNGYTVIGAVSQPDKKVGRKQLVQKTPVHELADQLGIPVLQPFSIREETDAIIGLGADLIVCCAYGQFIPEKILKAPKYGSLNLHPSLLPKYRGGAPVHRAVWNGDTETGVCLMEMVKKMDAGKVYAKTLRTIDPDDTTETLNQKLEEDAAKLIREDLKKYLEGGLVGEEQDDQKAVIAPNIAPEEEMVHFQTENIVQAYNHIRALIDWPIAYGRIDGKRVKFYKAERKISDHSFEPGTLIGFSGGAMEIACSGGILRILELQMEGKTRMEASVFANGSGRNLVGKKFE